MAYRILSTTDNQHVGDTLEYVEADSIVTFADGDVVAINKIFTSEDGQTILACGTNYQMTLTKE